MNIIPEFKKYEKSSDIINISKIHWDFSKCSDKRVVDAAIRIAENSSDGFDVKIYHENTNDEGYIIKITNKCIEISSEGAAGAFYGLQTFSQMLEYGQIYCGTITDYPDMAHRGFYHDITRGKIPKLSTLKELIDRLALLKINSLQLYVEHAFEFKVYEFCRERLGCITAEEILELDKYCYDRFIDFIPSLACFGHLYHLLQDGPYKHLSEISDYEPYLDYLTERHSHHTINPLKDESFEIIKSMLDEYIPLFRSEYFNICCDETLDLGKDVNEGKDIGELYFDFVNKIIDYVTSKGKKVMMWGDILANHPDYVKKLSDGITYLSWAYTDNPPMERFTVLYELNKPQIICSGTNSWNGFAENVIMGEKNIALLAKFVSEYNATGLLNTNWGDAGNLATIPMSYYGMTCGASVSWNKATVFNSDFRKKVSVKFYGHEDAVDLIAELAEFRPMANWYEARYLMSAYGTAEDSQYYEKAQIDIQAILDKSKDSEEYKRLINICYNLENRIYAMKTLFPNIRRDMINAVQGNAILLKWNAKLRGMTVDCYVDYSKWKKAFSDEWLENNKKGELDLITDIFEKAEKPRIE